MTGVDLERIRLRVAQDPVLAGAGPQRGPALRAAIARAVRAEQMLLDDRGLAAVVQQMTDLFTGLGPVEPLLRDPAVTDVMVNGPDEVWIERGGRLERTPVTYPDAGALHDAVLRVVGPQGLRFDRAHPTVDTRLPDGSRLHAVGPPLAADGPLVTVRKFATIDHTTANTPPHTGTTCSRLVEPIEYATTRIVASNGWRAAPSSSSITW